MRIDRCVCFNVPFSFLREVAREHDCTSIAALQVHVRFGLNCKLCHPYVERMLDTGEVVFSSILKAKSRDPKRGDERT